MCICLSVSLLLKIKFIEVWGRNSLTVFGRISTAVIKHYALKQLKEEGRDVFHLTTLGSSSVTEESQGRN